jgi:hypothetical protein
LSGGWSSIYPNSNVFISDVEKNEVTIVAGYLWSEIYGFLGKKELAAVGGEYTGVGMGRYSLIGGYGWRTGAHGRLLITSSPSK